MAAYRLAVGALDLVAAYEADLWDIGQQPDHKVLWGARFFCARIGAPAAFNVLPLTDQLGVNVAVHRFRDVVDRDAAAAADRGLPGGASPSAGDHVVLALAGFLRRLHGHRRRARI